MDSPLLHLAQVLWQAAIVSEGFDELCQGHRFQGVIPSASARHEEW